LKKNLPIDIDQANGVIRGASIADLVSPPLHEESLRLGKYLVDKIMDYEFTAEINALYQEHNIVGKDGRIRQFKDGADFFKMLEELDPEIKRRGLIKDSRESELMTRVMRQELLGRDTSNELPQPLRIAAKYATTRSSLGFSLPALFEMGQVLVRKLPILLDHYPAVKDVIKNPKNVSDELKKEILRWNGIGTDKALFRNSSGNRRVFLNDEGIPYQGVKTPKDPLGPRTQGKKLMDWVEDKLDRSNQFLTKPLNAITTWGQQLTYITEVSNLFDKVWANVEASKFYNKSNLPKEVLHDFMDFRLAGQVGLVEEDLAKIYIGVQEALQAKVFMKVDEAGVRHYNIHAIVDNLDFRTREKFNTAFYDIIGQHIVRPDRGDLPVGAIEGGPTAQILTQFLGFKFAQFGKQMSPMLRRMSEGEANAAGAILAVATMSALASAMVYSLYNPEKAREDVFEAFTGEFDFEESRIDNAALGGALDVMLGIGSLNLIADPIFRFTGIPNPTAWWVGNNNGDAAQDFMNSIAVWRMVKGVKKPFDRSRFNDYQMNLTEWGFQDWLEYTSAAVGFQRPQQLINLMTPGDEK
jgi:hypothetical protein